MKKKCRVRLGKHSLAPHFFVSLPSFCVGSQIALMIPPYPLKEYQSVQKLLSVNLLTDMAANHYQHCQLVNRRRAPLKLARGSNLGSGSCQMSQQAKGTVETAIDWAQVMKKILMSCATAPSYDYVECRSCEKEIFILPQQEKLNKLRTSRHKLNFVQKHSWTILNPR